MPFFRQAPQLLAPFREGRREALEAVYRYYARPIDCYLRALARHARAPELAQASVISDLLQEVFMRAFSERARLAYDGLREFSPYLKTIARNCFTDLLRKRRSEPSLAWTEEPPDDPALPEMTQVYDPKVIAALQSYLSELPLGLRAVYEQRFVQGLSQEAACAALGLSRRALRTGEDRLRKGLRRALQLAGLLHDMQRREGAGIKVFG